MIPTTQKELEALAGEYVLGLLDLSAIQEIEAALPANPELRIAIAFWEEEFHPLSALATPADPPTLVWEKVDAQLAEMKQKAGERRWWDRPAPWRWSTAGFAAAAAGLLFYLMLGPFSQAPTLIAVLHAPQQDGVNWIATADLNGLSVRAIAPAAPPSNRSFELWAIPSGATRPRSIGVVPASGIFKLDKVPGDIAKGATLAISVEPQGGSLTGQPTGPIVFIGALESL